MDTVECTVIGGGVIGLACARELALSGKETIIIEKNSQVGLDTSSRNSEVIHAGIYYPKNSFKAQLCVQGKDLLYSYCKEKNISFKKCGKIIVATTHTEKESLQKILKHANTCGVNDLTLLSKQEVEKLEPEISAIEGILSPSTGIVDSHGLMLSLLGDSQDAGAMLALNGRLISAKMETNYIELEFDCDGESMKLKTKKLINAAGLFASDVANNISGKGVQIPQTHYYKGNYFSLSRKSPFSHLIYPVPVKGGLGIHSVNDLNGQVRFGPDVEYIKTIDYSINESKKSIFQDNIARYWPNVAQEELVPDFVGIRPKCKKIDDPEFNDFTIKIDTTTGGAKAIHLLGIESPGLTSTLAIAKHVIQNL